MKPEKIEGDLESEWKDSVDRIARLSKELQDELKIKHKLEDLIRQTHVAIEFGYVPESKVDLDSSKEIKESNDRRTD